MARCSCARLVLVTAVALMGMATSVGGPGGNVAAASGHRQLLGGPLGSGDVNGDGLADAVVTGPRSGVDGKGETSAYVVFGKRDDLPVDLMQLGEGGFRIDHAGRQALLVGDVNGDGLTDIVAQGPTVSTYEGPTPRVTYLVFGKSSSAPVDLRRLGAGGIRIDDLPARRTVEQVGPAGDVNGDGLADVVFSMFYSGTAYTPITDYVVLGRRDPRAVHLAHAGRGVMRLVAFDLTGIAGAGDVNGDGLDDLVLGNADRGDCGIYTCGDARIVFGRRAGGVIDARHPGTAGLRLSHPSWAGFGAGVAGIGDVDGDGLSDVAISVSSGVGEGVLHEFYAPRHARGQPPLRDLSTRLFGIHDDSDLANPDGLGGQLGAAGDINHDGLADAVVTAADGGAYIVYGQKGRRAGSLTRLGLPLVSRLVTPRPQQFVSSITGVGDFNGDGFPDFIECEAPRHSRAPKPTEALVLFGSPGGEAVSTDALGGHGIALNPTSDRTDCGY